YAEHRILLAVEKRLRPMAEESFKGFALEDVIEDELDGPWLGEIGRCFAKRRHKRQSQRGEVRAQESAQIVAAWRRRFLRSAHASVPTSQTAMADPSAGLTGSGSLRTNARICGKAQQGRARRGAARESEHRADTVA